MVFTRARWSRTSVATIIAFCLHLIRAAIGQDIPAPIVFEPSGQWEGNDGPWGTFHIRIGTPAQIVRVLSATSLSSTWAVDPRGCPDGGICERLRGGLFDLERSSTWRVQGLYHLDQPSIAGLGYSGNGEYGLDTVGVDLSTGSTTMPNQVVAAFATDEFALGFLGMLPYASNFTSSVNNSYDSFFSSLQTEKRIASATWSYTAGAFNRNNSSPPSLIFGGYDSSRLERASSISLAMSDHGDGLRIDIQQITYTDKTYGLETISNRKIAARIDSMIPHMSLPFELCLAFERAYGLEWDNDTELYLINDTLHNSLVSRNIILKLTVGGNNSHVTIDFPYSVLDLTIQTPSMKNSSRYFPIRRAMNETQYILGRAFLQQVYITANYDRRDFKISRAVYNKDGDSHIFAIAKTNGTEPPQKTSPSTGSIVGTSIGIFAALIIAFTAFFIWYKKRLSSKKKTVSEAAQDDSTKAELDGKTKPFIELSTQGNEKIELETAERGELVGSPIFPTELPGVIPRYELYGGRTVRRC